MDKIKILNWTKEDIDNQFQMPANFWEAEHVIKYLDIENEKVKIEVKLYLNEQAYLSGANHIKTRIYMVDLNCPEFDGIKSIFLGVIKNGIEAMTDTINIDPVTLEGEEVPGFFNI